MAKIIGVGVGTQIRVGHSIVKVVRIHNDCAVLKVGNGPPFVVTETERTELGPDVFVSLGLRVKDTNSSCRLAFEAPRSVLIDRVRDNAVSA